MLQNDGGDVEIIDIKDTLVYCRLTGACQGCAAPAKPCECWSNKRLKKWSTNASGDR